MTNPRHNTKARGFQGRSCPYEFACPSKLALTQRLLRGTLSEVSHTVRVRHKGLASEAAQCLRLIVDAAQRHEATT